MSTVYDAWRPTAWHSAAASAPQRAFQKANDLAREAVRCNAVLAGFVKDDQSSADGSR
jgi:hypothetical protein